MIRATIAIAALLLTSLAWAAPPDKRTDEKDRAALLDGIETLARPGVPGNLVVFGEQAFVVVTGNARPEPVVAAAQHGKGRVVVMAHSGYLDASALAKPGDSRGRFFRNAITWTAGRSKKVRVGIIGNDGRLAAALTKAGFATTNDIDARDPHEAHVLIWKNGAGDAETAAAVTEFVEAGGGLIAAACPWGWAQVRAKQGLTVRNDLPENRALRPMGIVFADGTTDATKNGRFAVDAAAPGNAHAGRALRDLVQGTKGATERAYLVERALRALPQDDDVFLPAVERAIAKVGNKAVPRPGNPLGKRNALARLAVTVRSLRWRDLSPEDVEALPGADAFPGAVPRKAKRGARSFRLDPTIAGWQGTGLYLAAGEVLTVRVTTTTTGKSGAQAGTGWRVRIGCHADKLWKKDRWRRWPEITHHVPLEAGTTTTATPWGGTVYFEALRDARALAVEVKGAVAAPRFVLGDAASEKAWPENRRAPGPWAEIEGRNMVLSVPSETVRDLGDVKAVAEFWDAVLASHCDLAGTPLPKRRERFVPDAQISAGYMHSGYPIMMQLDTVTPPKKGALVPLLDVAARKTTSSWGYFHELGHNRQRGWWTFKGTTEVTCNLFSLYTHETLCGVEPWNNSWLENQKKKAKPYLEKGAPFAQWRRQPGLALIVYAQIQRKFGWAPFTKVFSDYEALPAADRPKKDQDKIDQFVVRISHATAHDLRPLWTRWGAPLSKWVRDDPALAKLPEWMPDFDELDKPK